MSTMIQHIVSIDFTTAGQRFGPFDISGVDDLYYRLERTEGASTLTGTLNIGYGLTTDDEPHDAAALTLDGTQGAIEVDQYAFAYFTVGTAQSGYKGVLHLYGRNRPIQTP